jgi:hypothetical protein
VSPVQESAWHGKLFVEGKQKKLPNTGGSRLSVILATQEADSRRIMVLSQPGQVVHKTLSQKTKHKKELVEWLKV